MTDTLRERIAQVLYGDGDEILWPRCLQLADLVLWELNLKPERSYGTTYPKVPVVDKTYVRYSTDWRAIDD